MKKILMIVLLVILILAIAMCVVFLYAREKYDADLREQYINMYSKEKQVDIQVDYVDEEKIELTVKNKDEKNRRLASEYFVLLDSNRMPVRLKKHSYVKTFIICDPANSKKVTFKWKEYLGENLKKGKYTMYWIGKTNFEIL